MTSVTRDIGPAAMGSRSVMDHQRAPGAVPDPRFRETVILPLAGLMALTLVLMVGVLAWTASQQNAVAVEQSIRLARGALQVRSDQLARNLRDYGHWDDAYRSLHLARDTAWADANVGSGSQDNLGFDYTVVIDPDDRVAYASGGAIREGEEPAAAAGAVLGDGFDRLLRAWRAGDPDGTTSGIVLAGGRPAIAVLGPVRPDTAYPDTDRGRRTVLAFAQVIDEAFLADVARSYLLPDLRLLPEGDPAAAAATASFELRTADGRGAGLLAWTLAMPGDETLRRIAPGLLALFVGLGALICFMLRHAGRSAELLRRSEVLAMRDALTGLPNRRLLSERLERAADPARLRRTDGAALLYLDLDGFKPVNDRLGHEAGDALLREVAARLLATVRDTDTVARLGGDEFVILQTPIASRDDVAALARRVVDRLAEPYRLAEGEARIGVSVGIAVTPDDGAGAELLRRADHALYEAKARGRGGWRFHGDGEGAMVPRRPPPAAAIPAA